MFSRSGLRGALIGTALSASALGVGSAALAQNRSAPPPSPDRTPPQRVDVQDSPLNASSGIEQCRGALKDCRAPEYDGPVKWGGGTGSGAIVLTGLMGACGGLFAGALVSGKKRGAIGGALVGGLALGAVGAQCIDNFIQFETRIETVTAANPPHYETRQQGKRRVSVGPFFGQVVSIPETDLLLAANNEGAPFIDGQKVRVTFAVDKEHRIVAWKAEAAKR